MWSRGSPCLHWVHVDVEYRLPLVYTGSRWMWSREFPLSILSLCGWEAESPLSTLDPCGCGAEGSPHLQWVQVDVDPIYTGSSWTCSRGSLLSTLGPVGLGAEAPPYLHWVQVDVVEKIPLLQVGSEWTSSRRSSLFCICLEISSAL